MLNKVLEFNQWCSPKLRMILYSEVLVLHQTPQRSLLLQSLSLKIILVKLSQSIGNLIENNTRTLKIASGSLKSYIKESLRSQKSQLKKSLKIKLHTILIQRKKMKLSQLYKMPILLKTRYLEEIMDHVIQTGGTTLSRIHLMA